MKKGINIYAIPDTDGLPRQLEIAADAGFHGVELNVVLASTDGIPRDASAEQLAAIRQSASNNGLDIPSVLVGPCLRQFALTSGDEAVRERGENLVKAGVDIACELGAHVVLVPEGWVNESVPYEVAWKTARDAFTRVGEYAADHGKVVGIENVRHNFLVSPIDTRDFVDDVGMDFVGVYFDVANNMATGFPEQWIRILGPRIRQVHFKDFSRDSNRFMPLLYGDVNWAAVRTALTDIGYDGYVVVEQGPRKEFASEEVYEVSRKMDLILGGSLL